MILEVKNIYKSFSGTQVLHGVNFPIHQGKALGFLGRNGAGKTTAIRILMGLFPADSGEILIDGKPFRQSDHSIGYLPEERGMYPKQKVLEQLIYFGSLRGLKKNQAKESSLYWLGRLGVTKYKENKLETLSKGNQQKIQLAQTLLGDPKIVVLDEPFSGLDPVNSQILKDIISELIERERLVIFSSHQMSYVEEFCEEIALIDKGEIVLTGNLNQIKKEYGEDRMTVSSLDIGPAELKAVLESKIGNINVLEVKKDYLVIKLLGSYKKMDLLSDLIDLNINIRQFSVYEPSLTDIFVETVGDVN